MLFALILWLAAGAAVFLFTVNRWWFPEAISAHAKAYDSQFLWTLAICAAIFMLAHALLGWAALRFRDRGVPARHSTGNVKIEWLWTAATAVLFIGMMLAGNRIWASLHFTQAPPDAIRVEVSAKQFAWSFRYPGADGKFGRTRINLVNDAAGNPFGIDPEDPASKDDITSSALRVPAGRPVALVLQARDVIHNFFVRELRLKQDIVPGMAIPLTFQADRTGTYEVACSELCGLGHHQMRSTMQVMSPEAFEEWLAEQPTQ